MRARGRKGCVWLWALAVGWHASAGDVSGAGRNIEFGKRAIGSD